MEKAGSGRRLGGDDEQAPDAHTLRKEIDDPRPKVDRLDIELDGES